MAYVRNFVRGILLAGPLSGCAIGEMPGGEPVETVGADTDADDDDDGAAPLTTSAGPADDDDANADDTGGDAAPDDDDAGSAGDDRPADDDAGDDDADAGDDLGDTGAVDDGATDDAGDTDDPTDAGESGGEADGVDLSGFSLVQTSSDRTLTFPAGTVLLPGRYLVIGRNGPRAAFEAFWGALPDDAIYIDGATLVVGEFPTINGDETYALRDESDLVVDGPTAALIALSNAQRVDPGEPAALATSWAPSMSPNADATPGAGQSDSPLFSGVYISEVSDATGAGNYLYEFVELYFDP